MKDPNDHHILVLIASITVLLLIFPHYFALKTNQQDFHSLLNPTSIYTFTQSPTIIQPMITGSSEQVYLFSLDYWSVMLKIYSNGSALLTVKYVGDRPLEISNGLLPFTAGLNIRIEYFNGASNVIRKIGAYFPNATITPGDEDTIGFNVNNAKMIHIEGKILGEYPVRILIPLTSHVSSETVIITRTVTVTEYLKTITTTIAPTCKFIEESSYNEPPLNNVKTRTFSNGTIISDGVLKVYVPLEIQSYTTPITVPITVENVVDTPVYVRTNYVEVEIVNASRDGINHIPINMKFAYAAPTTTIPLPPGCIINIPKRVIVIPYDNIVWYSNKTIIPIWLPQSIEGYGEAKGWMFIRATIKYAPVKEIYSILGELESYVMNYRAVVLYDWREVNILAKIFIAS